MKNLGKIFVFLVIIGVGVGAFLYFRSAKKEPERERTANKAMVVDVTEAKLTDESVTVSVMGTVIPAKSISLISQVSGQIVAQNKNLVPGGQIKKGQLVLRLDPRDYDLVLEQQRARVTRASMELSVEQGRKAVAEQEWNLIRDEVRPTEAGRKLALREVHLESAEAALASAESSLEGARINRKRTVLRAPFNALVTQEFVDVGQVVGPSTRLATLVASDKFWVRVSVPVDQLSWIKIPGVIGKEGSKAQVFQKIGQGHVVRRSGQVTKLLGELDPVGKMALLLIEVKDPLVVNNGGDTGGMPLLLGANVSVEIDGPKLDGVLSLPRYALREDSKVWVKEGHKLAIKSVEVVWTKDNEVFVRGDIQPGVQVITTRLNAPAEGMYIKLESEPSGVESPSVRVEDNGKSTPPVAASGDNK